MVERRLTAGYGAVMATSASGKESLPGGTWSPVAPSAASWPERLPAAAYGRLIRYRRQVEKRFPGKVEDVILFGSRARGTAKRGADYDVAVVVTAASPEDRKVIGRVLSDVAYAFVVQGIAIRPVAVGREFLQSASPLAFEIARDGVSIP